MVNRESGLHDPAHRQLPFPHNRLLFDGAHRQNGRVGREDDGRETVYVEHAQVADAEGGAAIFLIA